MLKILIKFFKNLSLTLTVLAIAGSTLLGTSGNLAAASRLKDILEFEGVRENMLVGYGLVVGLNNTGDTLKTGHFTKQSLQSMLNRMGVKPTDSGLDSKNVAAVMVTAALPAFARQGGRIDVTVSALGDSKSLLGGTLLVTPLLGAVMESKTAQKPLYGGVVGGKKIKVLHTGMAFEIPRGAAPHFVSVARPV